MQMPVRHGAPACAGCAPGLVTQTRFTGLSLVFCALTSAATVAMARRPSGAQVEMCQMPDGLGGWVHCGQIPVFSGFEPLGFNR